MAQVAARRSPGSGSSRVRQGLATGAANRSCTWPARDPVRLAASLEEFAGHPACGIAQLRDDLERFVILLGGSDGEPLFGP